MRIGLVGLAFAAAVIVGVWAWLGAPVAMPNAPLGSEYPTHGNRQAGELPVGPTDPRAQLANGLPNNAEAGGYGAPLAGVHNNTAAPGM